MPGLFFDLPRAKEDPGATPPGVLTACLACRWVHGFPWPCPTRESLAVMPSSRPRNAREAFRVGKANALHLTPHDWSTLSNGTVDGELHREFDGGRALRG